MKRASYANTQGFLKVEHFLENVIACASARRQRCEAVCAEAFPTFCQEIASGRESTGLRNDIINII